MEIKILFSFEFGSFREISVEVLPPFSHLAKNIALMFTEQRQETNKFWRKLVIIDFYHTQVHWTSVGTYPYRVVEGKKPDSSSDERINPKHGLYCTVH